MNIAFAVVFVALICFSETARHGVFGLSPSEVAGSVHAALVIGAVFILRGDILRILLPPASGLYGYRRLNWSWGRSLLGLLLGPLLWIVPFAYGALMLRMTVLPDVSVAGLAAAFAPLLLIAMAEGVFLREAVLKAFAPNRAHIYAVSTLAIFIFYVPMGVPEAVVAASAGLYFTTLRLIGANILAVAAVQAASVTMFTSALTVDVNGMQLWIYAAYFALAATLLSLFVYSLFSTQKGSISYA